MIRPKVVLFNGLSLDGRMDGGGESQAEMGLYYELASRWKADAMLSGSQTILSAFSGQEEVPPAAGPKELHPLAVPLLVVVDSRARIRCWNLIKGQVFWQDVVVLVSEATPRAYLDELETKGVRTIIAGGERVDLAVALEQLATGLAVRCVRVDSGGVLNGVLLRAGLVDEVSVLISPALVGGTSPRTFFVAPDVRGPEQVIPLRLFHHEEVKEGLLWLRYEVLP
ncbi:MAG: RibD family protein [Anaerolineales bacterium]|nr:RibD family protein [Anaerolineales bacterium]